MKAVVACLLLAHAVVAQMDASAMVININPGPDKAAKLVVGDPATKSLMFMEETKGVLNIFQNAIPILEFDTANVTVTSANKNITGVIRADGNLNVTGTLYADDMDVDTENDLAQWALIYHDLFHESSQGWSTNYTSTCGNPYKILGGHCKLSGTSVDKTFDKLPVHKAVRIVARYYFIDDWDDYTGFMKVDGHHVWTEEYAHCKMPFRLMCTKSKSICGKEDDPDKIGRLIDIAYPHDADSVQVEFGSTMVAVDPCDASYGVQGVSVYVR